MNVKAKEVPMGMGRKLVSDAELVSYRASLDWYGYGESDFELREKPDPYGDGDVEHPRGWVVIRRKDTDVTRHYRTGIGRRWTDEFEDDLKRGAFRGR